MSEIKEYRKYVNRRFYDQEAHSYVNLNQISREVHNGMEIRVHLHKTGEDITAEVLFQILMERQQMSRSNPIVSLQILHDMVRSTTL